MFRFPAPVILFAAVSTGQKVDVQVLSEAGCPPCQDLIKGELDTLVHTLGMADIMVIDQHPWGNNYYTTEACGGGPYNSTTRQCWAQRCVGVDAPPSDCFSGEVVPQHGLEEYKVNKMEACAKNVVTDDWLSYWPFLVCMEKAYENEGLNATEACAAEANLSYAKLSECYDGSDGDAALAKEAMSTPEHPGTPWVKINGMDAERGSLLKQICGNYTGSKPTGCLQLELVLVSGAGDHDALLEQVDPVIQAKGVSEIISLTHYPIGNMYVATDECGGEPYQDANRHCWSKMCHKTSFSDPVPHSCEAYPVTWVAPLGQKEVDFNQAMGCGQKSADNWQQYWSFATCMAKRYEADGANATLDCAGEASLDVNNIQICLAISKMLVAVDQESTPDHPATPYAQIRDITGMIIEVLDMENLLSAICSAYNGTKPEACSSEFSV